MLLLASSAETSLSFVGHWVTEDTIVHAFVTSRVDYCNSVLASAPKTINDELQRVLNAAARLISCTSRYDRGLSALLHDELHWLDIPQRVQYKLACRDCPPVSPESSTDECIVLTYLLTYLLWSGVGLKIEWTEAERKRGREIAWAGVERWAGIAEGSVSGERKFPPLPLRSRGLTWMLS